MENKIENLSEQDAAAVKAEESKKAEDKKDKKGKKEKKPRRPAKVVLKTWSKGLSKETSRIAWEKKSQVVKDFVVIVVIACILAALFLAIDMIIISIRK